MDDVKIKIGNYRWGICALLFFATTTNYIDRNVFSFLKPTLQKEIGWTETEYGYIVAAFSMAYALSLLFVGTLIDKFGTKKGYTSSVSVWSFAAIGHAFAATPFGFGVARAALAVGESGNFPAAIKTVAEWFPKKERALAAGIFNSGANIGAVVVPLVVPWLTLTYGWQSAFIATGAIGFVWVLLWLIFYKKPEDHKKLSKAELDYILSDKEEVVSEKIPWLKLLKYKQSWAFAIAKFLTDPIWWFYLYWLPGFLNKKYGLDLTNMGWPLIIVYTMTTIGSVGGGWLSGRFMKMGWEVNKSRKFVMIICAIIIVPAVFATSVSLWTSVFLIGLALAAHQGWSANLFTTVSDMFPKKAVASITGLGGMTGAAGGVLFAAATGIIIDITGSYTPLFIISGSIYLLALLIFHLLVPKLKPAEL